MIAMKFGERLKLERNEQKISQAVLAEAVGCSQPAIYKLEKNAAESSAYASKIAKFLGVNVNWLLNGEGVKYISSQENKAAYGYITNKLETVPILDYSQLSNYKEALKAHVENRKRLRELPVLISCKNNEYCFYYQINDNSNYPELITNEHLLIDTVRPPLPGNFVLVKGHKYKMVGRLSMELDGAYSCASLDNVKKCRVSADMNEIIGVKIGSYRDGL